MEENEGTTIVQYKEIYDIVLPEKKRKEEKHNLFGHYIGRPISILMTIPLIDKPITPTDVTKVSMIVALIGFCFFSKSNLKDGRGVFLS